LNTAERKRMSERRTRRVDGMWRKGAERWRRGRAIERGRKRGKEVGEEGMAARRWTKSVTMQSREAEKKTYCEMHPSP
jgi:hypothetical protein